MVPAHSWPVSHQTYCPHVHFHLHELYFFSPCQPQLTRKKVTSCSRVTPSTRASSTSRQSKRPTASSSADAAKSKRTPVNTQICNAVLPEPLNCPSKIHFPQLCSALHIEQRKGTEFNHGAQRLHKGREAFKNWERGGTGWVEVIKRGKWKKQRWGRLSDGNRGGTQEQGMEGVCASVTERIRDELRVIALMRPDEVQRSIDSADDGQDPLVSRCCYSFPQIMCQVY